MEGSLPSKFRPDEISDSLHPTAVVPDFIVSERQVLRFFGHFSEGNAKGKHCRSKYVLIFIVYITREVRCAHTGVHSTQVHGDDEQRLTMFFVDVAVDARLCATSRSRPGTSFSPRRALKRKKIIVTLYCSRVARGDIGSAVSPKKRLGVYTLTTHLVVGPDLCFVFS